MVFRWMYQEHFSDLEDREYKEDLERTNQDEVLQRSRQDQQRPFELYYLAEKLLIQELKLQICEQLAEIKNRGINLRTLALDTILSASQHIGLIADSPLWQFICCELAMYLQRDDGRPLEHYGGCFDNIPGLLDKVMKMSEGLRKYSPQRIMWRDSPSVYALYYMADKFFMKKLQDEVLKCIIDLYLITREGSPPFAPEAVAAIYRETKVGSPIRLFAVDALAYSFMNQGLDAVEMRPVFLEHPIMAADFIEAIRGICGAGEDYMTVRARHRRYIH